MKTNKKLMIILGGALITAVVGCVTVGVMYCKIREFNTKHQCDVLAGLSKEELAKKLKEANEKANEKVEKANEKVNEKPVLAVEGVEYNGDTQLSVVLNERPDMDVVKNYIKVAPMAEGVPSYRYGTRYNYRSDKFEPIIYITGEYAYRTNVTLRILKGFPLYGKGANPTAEGSLTNDFEYVFKRNDPSPYVAYADNGRYLPPGGRKAIRIETISVTNVATEIRRVEPRNIVQLMAREECQYRRYSYDTDADQEETEELSGACETGMVRCVNRPCEKEIHLMPVAMKDGGPERGVFLIAIRNGDRVRNPNFYRLVCLSDLGLSVRQGKQGLGVWVTSLTTGRPKAGAQVEVYSSANILLASGETDANGWYELGTQSKEDPFAIVVFTAEDMTFMAIRDSMKVDETYPDGARQEYLEDGKVDAFLWTERGIYRHGEKIFIHALLRNNQLQAPDPMPVVLTLRNPRGNICASETVLTDKEGALMYDRFTVGENQPSGKWSVEVRLPGKDGTVLAENEVKIEEFAPPQIRVQVTGDETQHPSNFTFKIAAEHLFGGPARNLRCEGAVVFEDVPFAPKKWKQFTFGNEELGLKPCFRQLSQRMLDENGVCEYYAPLWADSGRPKAAVRATGQGTVLEDGGRPATARKSIICHYYPYYIGSNLASWLKLPETGLAKIELICVKPDGSLLEGSRKLVAKIDRIETVYSYRKNDDGQSTWDCDHVRSTVYDQIKITTDEKGTAVYALPMKECGDYVLTVTDTETGVTFGKTFYLSDWGDDEVRAPLNNPTEVTIRTDKAYYRVGDIPRLMIKSPFAGYARLSVMRDDVVYEEVLNLTNATSEVMLRPVERAWAPNVDVAISVVQSVNANANHLAARAHGLATVWVRPLENELKVDLQAEVKISEDQTKNSQVVVDLDSPGATSAVVTLVDEGINLLTGEKVPDPIERLSRVRSARHPLYDLFSRILPVADDALKTSGIKTGGGFGAEMLGRVSPVPTRRFKPLALWKRKVALKDGKAQVVFDIPEFVGEIRVTAVAYSGQATGSAAIHKKVTPKLVMQPDAPRFVAPEDGFQVTLPLRNCGSEKGEVHYAVRLGEGGAEVVKGEVVLPVGGSTNICALVKALSEPGEMEIVFEGTGFGERHTSTIQVPVRPAVASVQSARVISLNPGDEIFLNAQGDSADFRLSITDMQFPELVHALEWLAEYPHGCLEQTTSRIFPLLTGGGVLNEYPSAASSNRMDYIAAGVDRVESMIRENDFVMWPDCNYAPWDREVSLYAAHFLIEAERNGQKLAPWAKSRVTEFLKQWAMSDDTNVSAYACHTLALAGHPEKDRMFRLYDVRTQLNALTRARLARAFVAIHDRSRAEALMKYAIEPQSIKEAAFTVLALVDLDPKDERIPGLIQYLEANRDRERLSWGTTEENAHALLAIGAYLSHHIVKKNGEPHLRYSKSAKSIHVTNDGNASGFLSCRRIEWPSVNLVTNEANGIFISRRYLRLDGDVADLSDLLRGEMLVAELTITSDVTRVVSDLVIEDLFAGAFEPVHLELNPGCYMRGNTQPQVEDWVMRKDARDDRMLVFSEKFKLEKGHEAKVFYPVRVVSAGDFILPGPAVEGMYNPLLRARRAPGRIVVRH